MKISKISCVNDWTFNKIVPFTVTPLELTCKYLYKSPTFLIAIEIQSMLCMRYDDDKEIKLCHWVSMCNSWFWTHCFHKLDIWCRVRRRRLWREWRTWFFFQSRIFTRQYMHSTFFTTHHFYHRAWLFVNLLLQQRRVLNDEIIVKTALYVRVLYVSVCGYQMITESTKSFFSRLFALSSKLLLLVKQKQFYLSHDSPTTIDEI